jgi:aminopeptidase N
MQYLRGDQEYYASLMSQRSGIINKAPVVSGKHKTEEDVYDDKRGGPGIDIYSKGSLVLHTLRNLVGDQAFFAAVRKLVYGEDQPKPGSFKPRYGTTQEFIAAVNQAAGRDLGWFFQAYLYQAGLPELQASRNGGKLDLAWKTAGDTPFPMPVEVRVGQQLITVAMANGKASIDLPQGATFTLDPHSKILRREPRIEQFQAYKKAQSKAKSGT